MYTIAFSSLVRPLLILLSLATRTFAAPLKVKYGTFSSTTVVSRSPCAQTQFRVRTFTMEEAYVAEQETVRRAEKCPLGCDNSMVCFRYHIVAAFWRVESWATTHGDSAFGGPLLFPCFIHAFRRIYAFAYTDVRVDRNVGIADLFYPSQTMFQRFQPTS